MSDRGWAPVLCCFPALPRVIRPLPVTLKRFLLAECVRIPLTAVIIDPTPQLLKGVCHICIEGIPAASGEGAALASRANR